MKRALAFLVNNTFYYETMLRNMPKQSKGIKFLIVNEIRIGDKTEEIKRISKKYGIDAEVYGSREVTEICCKFLKLTPSGKAFIRSYTMGMNILFQFFVLRFLSYDKVFFMDDDVVLNADMGPIMDKFEYAFMKLYFSYDFTDKEDESNYDSEFKRVARVKNNKEWKAIHISGGQRIYSWDLSFLELYRNMLEWFYNNEAFSEAWENGKAGIRGYKQKCFYLDQNFENCLIRRAKIGNDELKPYVNILLSAKNLPRDLKQMFRKPITHYTVGHGPTSKEDFIHKMQEEGALK
jgi:hypothetical protein